jgi:hypothetical protein
VLCVSLLALIIVPGTLADGWSPSLAAVGWTFGLLCAVVLPWEWRARRMGIRITEDGIIAVRAIDSVHLTWDEIATFFVRPAGLGLWGDGTIRVQRKQFAGRNVPAKIGMALPTIVLLGQSNPIGRWLGPCDLVGEGETVPQERVLAFLNTELARSAEARPRVSALGWR